MSASILQISTSPGGVPKLPVPEAIVSALGVESDGHAHPEVHGGSNKALLLITAEGIDELVAEGYPIFPGALGENITTVGLDRRTMRLGQRYRIGEIEVELVKLRTPCKIIQVYGPTIAKSVYDEIAHAGDPESPRWGLGGFYARVIKPGRIRQGDQVVLLGSHASASEPRI